MPTELKKLQRRPFLLPLLMPLALTAIVVIVGLWALDARSNMVAMIVRGAEVETGAGPDPSLSLTGKERAARLARIMGHTETIGRIHAIFAIDTNRAQQTVAPLAEALRLPITVVPAANWDNLPSRLRRDYRGQVVLIVADAPQAMDAIQALSGESVAIGDNEYDALYVAFLPRIARTRLLALRY